MFNQLNFKVTHADEGFILTVTNPDDAYGPPLATYALTDTFDLQQKIQTMIAAYEDLPDVEEDPNMVFEAEPIFGQTSEHVVPLKGVE